jgi:hypothetical protein
MRTVTDYKLTTGATHNTSHCKKVMIQCIILLDFMSKTTMSMTIVYRLHILPTKSTQSLNKQSECILFLYQNGICDQPDTSY